MIKSNRQKEILHSLALKYGISIGQADDIWDSFCHTIQEEIVSQKKDEEGYYDISKFKVIHIDNFGKFVPKIKMIESSNKKIKQFRDDSTT